MLLAQGRERTGEGLVEDSVGSGAVWDGLVGGGVMEVEGTWWCGRGGEGSGMVEWWAQNSCTAPKVPTIARRGMTDSGGPAASQTCHGLSTASSQ